MVVLARIFRDRRAGEGAGKRHSGQRDGRARNLDHRWSSFQL